LDAEVCGIEDRLSARLLPFLMSAGVRVFQALHEEQPTFLKTLPEERVFKKSKWPDFPG
jgi:hypothetical protein